METHSILQKGTYLQRIDDISRDPEKRSQFLEALRDETNDYLDDVLVAHGVVREGDMASRTVTTYEHMRQHLFPRGNDWENMMVPVWWREHQPITPIYRRGYARAFELSEETEKPVDGHWLAAGDRVAIIVKPMAEAILMLRLTPPCPYARRPAPRVEVTETVETLGIEIIRPIPSAEPPPGRMAIYPWEDTPW